MGSRAMPKPGETIAGKYRIESLIGEGGMGAVFAAQHALTGKRVALKWMLPEAAGNHEAVQRLLREASAAGRIDHPSVVDIYDVGEHLGAPFLVMELLHGETLSAALDRRALSVPEILQCVLGAIEGVAAAHDMRVIHRDIKPDNIFLCRDASGQRLATKVLDFGISKVTSSQSSASLRLTRTGAVIGTPYYMSPEQIRGEEEIDHRADVYALGVILYEALTGRVPFDANTYSALVLAIATGTAPRPSEVNPRVAPALERIVLKAMAREPGQRYADVRSLGVAIADYLAHDGVPPEVMRSSATASTPFASELPPVLPVSRAPKLVAAAAVVGLLALVGSWWSGAAPELAPSAATAIAAEASAAAAAAPPGPQPVVPATIDSAAQPAPAPDAGLAAAERPVAATRAPAEAAVSAAQLPPPRVPSDTQSVAKPAAPRGELRPRPTRPSTQASAVPAPSEPPAVAPKRPSASGRSGVINADEF